MSLIVAASTAVAPDTSFALAELSARQLVPVSRAVDTVAIMRKVQPAVHSLTTSGASEMTETGGLVGMLTATGATAVSLVTGSLFWGPLVAGTAAALTVVSAGAGVILHRRVNRQLSLGHGDDLARLEARVATAVGIDRALIVACAEQLDRTMSPRPPANWLEKLIGAFGVRSDSLVLTKQVKALAALRATVSPEQMAEAEGIMALMRNASSANDQLETALAGIEKLSPEGRDCVRPLIEEQICKGLDAVPGNALRRQRFLEALDGQRTPYVAHAAETSGLADGLEPGIVIGSSTPLRSLAAAALVVQRAFATITSVSIDLSSLELAREAGAYFERRGFRAAIRETAPDRVALAVYEAGNVPSDVFSRRECEPGKERHGYRRGPL